VKLATRNANGGGHDHLDVALELKTREALSSPRLPGLALALDELVRL